MLPLLQEAAAAAHAAGPHPLAGSAAELLWLVPMLPLLGVIINGLLSVAAAFHRGPADPSAAHVNGHGEAAAVAHAHDADHEAGHDEEPHALQPHRFAGITSFIGPAVLIAAFIVSATIFIAMRG